MNAPTAAIARPRGPIVWLDMDQQQLDDAYDQLIYAPTPTRWSTRSPPSGISTSSRRRSFSVTYETPEFQRQTRDFAAAVKAADKPAELLVGEAYNHFEMLETLASPYGLLGRAVLKQMGLT